MSLQTSRRALAVDPNAGHRWFLTEILGEWNFTTATAKNEQEAIALAGRDRFDLVVLDIKEPPGDEHLFVQHLREQNSKVPIIAVSNWRSARRWAEQIGVDAFLEKPFDLNELKEVVTRLCHLS